MPENDRVDSHQAEFPFDLPLLQLGIALTKSFPGKGIGVSNRLRKVGEWQVALYLPLEFTLIKQNFHQGCLSPPVAPQEAELPATINAELTAVKKRGLARIGEGEVFDSDVSHLRITFLSVFGHEKRPTTPGRPF